MNISESMNDPNGFLFPLRHPKQWLNNQPRWNSFKRVWDRATTKAEKLKAIIHLSNGIANMTFPFQVRHHKTGVLLRWEAAYDELANEAEKLYLAGKDSFKEPRIFWWRQLNHLIGGLILGLVNLPLMAAAWCMIIMLIPFWHLSHWPLVAAILMYKVMCWTPTLTCLVITAIQARKEFTQDISRNKWKNYIDVAFWTIGSGLWVLIFM